MNIRKEIMMALKLLARIDGLSPRHKDCGFTNFITEPANKSQFEICKKWDGKTSMTLTGGAGTGKTHLAIAMLKNYPMVERDEKASNEIKNRLEYDIRNDSVRYGLDGKPYGKEDYQRDLDNELWKYRSANCYFVSLVELFVKINNAALNTDKMEILEKYCNDPYEDCTCFDDLGAEKLTEAKRENLYYIIDSRYRNMKPTIITSNFTIKEISDNEPRIASRLAEMGDILYFGGKDYRKNK